MSVITEKIKASEVFIYPSANASDGGQLHTENNLKRLIDKFSFRSFVIKRSDETEPYGLQVSYEKVENKDCIKILQGSCVIEGHYIKLTYDEGYTYLDLDTIKDENNQTIKQNPNVVYHILLALKKDASGCVMGDYIPPKETHTICRGISYKLVSNIEEFADPYVELGTVICDSQGNITVTDSMNKYCIIDTSQIGSNGISLEEWIRDLIDSIFNSLSQLTLIEKDDKKPTLFMNCINNSSAWIRNTGDATEVVYKDASGRESSIKINSQGLIYQNSSDSMNIYEEIKNFMNASGELAPANGTTSTDQGTNYNGKSSLRARADHYHGQYIRNSSSQSGSDVTQTIGTRIKFNQAITTADINCSGNITGSGSGIISGFSKVYNAVWNDYADAVLKKENEEINPGDIVVKDPYTAFYEKSKTKESRMVVGVCSDTYGHLLGGDEGKSEEENLKKYVPIAVSGNVKVKVLGCAEGGDFIVSSEIPGIGVATKEYIPGCVIGKVLEAKESEGIDRVLVQVMLI